MNGGRGQTFEFIQSRIRGGGDGKAEGGGAEGRGEDKTV